MPYKIKDANIELHVHPFLGNNSVVDVVRAMERTKLDVVAMESLDDSLFPYVVEEITKHYVSAKVDGAGILLPNGSFILNAREYNTKEGLHVLTVGYSMDDATPQTEIRSVIDRGLEHNALVLLDHIFVDNHKTKTAGHISPELEEEVEKLCKEYSRQVTLEWNGYCIDPMRKFIMDVSQGVLNNQLVNKIAKLGSKIPNKTACSLFELAATLGEFNWVYYDVNKKAEELSEKLRKGGYNVPIVTDTDLHARSRGHLEAMGTSRIIVDLEGETPSDLVKSMKEGIFAGKHQNTRKYVSSAHLLSAFCFPVILPKYFKKPRA